MVKVVVSIDHTDMDKLQDKMDDVTKRTLQYTANFMIYQLQIKSPIDTGYLKGWFKFKEYGDEVDIRSPAEYAIYQNYGTYSYGLYKTPPKSGKAGGIKPKMFVENSLKATEARIGEFAIKAIQEVIK